MALMHGVECVFVKRRAGVPARTTFPLPLFDAVAQAGLDFVGVAVQEDGRADNRRLWGLLRLPMVLPP